MELTDDRMARRFATFIIAALSFAIYVPALSNGFVGWDDPVYVTENPNLALGGMELLKWAFTTTTNAQWHPIASLSHALDYKLFGLEPFGHHLTSVIVHTINSTLVFILTLRLVATVGANRGYLVPAGTFATSSAFITALIFALHPLHVESVAWVTERRDLLFALFYLLSILSYLYYAGGRNNKAAYLLSLLFFICSVMSKPMAVTLPVVLLIVDFYPLERIGRGRGARGFIEGFVWNVIEKAPFFIVSLLAAAITVWAMKGSEHIVSLTDLTAFERILVAIHGYIFYLYKAVIPLNLAPLYPFPDEIRFFSAKYLVPVLLFILISAACALTVRRERLLTALWLFYLVTLLPVIGIMRVGAQEAADRYSYLPIIAPFLLAAIILAIIYRRLNERTGKAVIMLIVLVGSITLLNLTVRQTYLWSNTITLWSHEISIYPDSVAGAYYNRGIGYLEAGETRKAITDLSKAIELNPNYVSSYNNRGVAYASIGNYEMGIKDFKRALALDPDDIDALRNIALSYLDTGNRAEAERYYKRGAKLGDVQSIEILRQGGGPIR